LIHFENIQSLTLHYERDAKHPLINVQRFEDVKDKKSIIKEPMSFAFYVISWVRNFNGFIQIGDNQFTGDHGILHFVKPGQIYTCNSTSPWEGFQILIHPDIFKKHFEQQEISAYDFFAYEVNESLLLAEEEKGLVANIMEMTWKEYHNGKDHFSIPILLSYISTLLSLSERFYARQFETRKSLTNQLSANFYHLLKNYYTDATSHIQQPNVHYFAEQLHVTPNYLSDAIRHDTGKSALVIIQDFVIEKAKKRLANTTQTVAEISYSLGFEYPNYFSRLFKRKTNLSPSQYRESVKSI
jgi:AraC family transcriptional activator of pobA